MLPDARHSLTRNLAALQTRGTITHEMREAALDLHQVILDGSRPVLQLLGRMGGPASSCLVHVLGLGWPLKAWAQAGWHGQRLNQETASGVFVCALGILVDGDARLLLDRALEVAAARSAAA